MQWLGRICSLRTDKRVEHLATEIADQMQLAAWQAVVVRAGTLATVAEAQAYIRSRVRRLVHRKVVQSLSRSHHTDLELAQRITARTLHLLSGRLAGLLVVGDIQPTRLHRAA